MKTIISIARPRSLREECFKFFKKLGWEDEDPKCEEEEALIVHPTGKHGEELLFMEKEVSLKSTGAD